MSGSNHGPRNERRRAIPRIVSATENAIAIVRARRSVPPPISTAAKPEIGMISRRDRKSPTSRPPEDPGEEPQHDGEDEDRDDPEDHYPGVILDLPCLAGPERETRSYRLEADAVHGTVDHLPVGGIGQSSDDEAPPRHRVHDSDDDGPIGRGEGLSERRDGPGAERAVPV